MKSMRGWTASIWKTISPPPAALPVQSLRQSGPQHRPINKREEFRRELLSLSSGHVRNAPSEHHAPGHGEPPFYILARVVFGKLRRSRLQPFDGGSQRCLGLGTYSFPQELQCGTVRRLEIFAAETHDAEPAEPDSRIGQHEVLDEQGERRPYLPCSSAP